MVFLAGCPSQSGRDSESSLTDGSSETASQRSTATPTTTVTPTVVKFELRDLQYPENLTVGDIPEIRVEVENVGEVGGVGAITLFWADSATPETIELEPGTRGTITFTPEPVASDGTLTFRVAAHSDSSIQGEIQVTGRDLHYVGPDGADDNPGTKQKPLETIQHALTRANPGDTIQVQPGRYTPRGGVETVRAGTAEKPITITGPPDAVYNANDPFIIDHSHVHLTGLTFDGLLDPDNPDDPDSYSWGLLEINGAFHDKIKNGEHRPDSVKEDNYLGDIVVKPHAVGNCRADLIKVHWSKNVEIGEFKVIGPAGVKYLKGDASGHNGEVVYLGNAADKGYPVDATHDVHVHHIDNSEGHPHAELVDVKSGCYNVLIEYCTDTGGAGRYLLDGHDPTSETAFGLWGRNITLRWNVVENSHGQAVEVGTWGVTHPDEFEQQKGLPYPEELFDSGRANSIYGNRFTDNAGLAIQYPIIYPDDGESHIAEEYGPDEQTHVCGNVIDGETHGTPGTECPDDLRETNTIGHLGGDSPWA